MSIFDKWFKRSEANVDSQPNSPEEIRAELATVDNRINDLQARMATNNDAPVRGPMGDGAILEQLQKQKEELLGQLAEAEGSIQESEAA